MKYEYDMDFEISYSQVDPNLELSLSQAGYLAQQITTDYFRSFGSDNLTVSKADNAVWVLTKHRLHFLRTLKWSDVVHGHSITSMSRGYKTEVCSEFSCNGELAFISKQDSSVISLEKRSPLRIDSISYPKDMEVQPERFPLPFFRIRTGFSESDLVFTDHFRYSDTDYSHHVNNVAYLRYVTDALGREFFERNTLEDMEIQYHHECFPDTEFSLYRKDLDDHTIDMMFRNAGSNSILVRLVYRPRG